MTPAAAASELVEHELVEHELVEHELVEHELVEHELVELEVIPVGEDGWRVSIQGAEWGNPFALLGFVTRVGEKFEVCVIGRPGDAIEAASLDDAVEVLRPAAGEVAAILAGTRH